MTFMTADLDPSFKQNSSVELDSTLSQTIGVPQIGRMTYLVGQIQFRVKF